MSRPPVPDAVLRAALVEYIAGGPRSTRPPADRLAEQLPATPPGERSDALLVAREAVAAAAALATEAEDGHRLEESIEPELVRRYPWLRPGATPVRAPWWRRGLPGAVPEGDLPGRLRAYGYYLIK